MEYRKLPHGTEMLSTLGLGAGSLHNSAPAEIEAVVTKAMQNGVNYFDLCAGGKGVYEPFGRAIAGKRDKVYFQLHFGAIYNENGEYGWSRNLDEIKSTFAWELKALNTDYDLECGDEYGIGTTTSM